MNRTTERDSNGRLHLSVHRDPVGGGEALTLDVPVFEEAWQNDLAAAAANTAHGILRGQPTVERTVELARKAMAATSRMADGMLARAPEGAVACKAGCDHCCHQAVGVTAPEALAIFDHLKSTRSSGELARVAANIAARHAQTSHLSSDERFSPEHPCPFLDAGTCSIYDARPLACRGMNSLDAGECATRLRDPQARAEFLASGRGGHSYLEPIRAFHAISADFQLGLSELYHLDMRPLELTATMQLLLAGPEWGPGDWMGGRKPFESAVRADATPDEGLQDLSGAL